MAGKNNNDVPPVPVPPPGAAATSVPPIEPSPAAKTAPKTTASTAGPKLTKAATPPAVPVPAPAPSAPVAPAAPTPPPAPAYGAPGYAYAPPPAGPPQGLSITSMILGIAGLFFGFLVSIAAVVTGHMAQKSQPHAKPFWITGIITGYIGIGIGVIATIIFVIWLVFILSLSQAGSFSSF